MQDASPDSDPATSEGIFVFTSSAPTINVGQSVRVSATVQEFRPGGARQREPDDDGAGLPERDGAFVRQPAAGARS